MVLRQGSMCCGFVCVVFLVSETLCSVALSPMERAGVFCSIPSSQVPTTRDRQTKTARSNRVGFSTPLTRRIIDRRRTCDVMEYVVGFHFGFDNERRFRFMAFCRDCKHILVAVDICYY